MRLATATTKMLSVIVFVACGALAEAEDPFVNSSRQSQQSAYKVPAQDVLPSPDAHPLMPALQLAVESYEHIRRDIRDYSCTVVRRERVDGRLQAHEYMFAKVRHGRTRNGQLSTPFSVYLKFLGPAAVKDREVLFVENQNDGEIFARNGGNHFAYVTTRLKPESDLAMRGNRYPVTEFGFENLLRRLIEVAREEMAVTGNCQVHFFSDAKVDGRECLGVQVTHPARDERLRYHQAKIFMDDQWRIPIHYESYDWPREEGGEPVLLEQYTYVNVKLNVGLTDQDFDHTNPKYKLR